MKKILMMGTVFLLIIWAAVVWADLKEGLWEITTQTEIKGMPYAMPPTTLRQCITRNDPVPQTKDKNYECKTLDQKVTGNTVTYTVECKGKEGVMKTTGKTTYTDKSMNGESKTAFKMQGQPEMQMINKIKGRYIGNCPK
jgi:hypothetical protein